MSVTAKVSVSIDKEELRLAKTLTKKSGESLSAFVTLAVRRELADRARRVAAREFLATFLPEERATAEEMETLLALWNAPTRSPSQPRKKKKR